MSKIYGTNDTFIDSSVIYHVNKPLNEVLKEPLFCEALMDGVNVTMQNTRDLIQLNKFVTKNGNFEITNYGVKVPNSGVISVSASVMLSPWTGYSGIVIYKNSTYMLDTYRPAGAQKYGVIEMSERLLSVKAGDIIYLYVGASSGDVIQGSTRTRMTLKYLDY